MQNDNICRVIRPGAISGGKQALRYDIGISAHSVGATGIHLQRVFIPPLGKGKAHKHVGHETALLGLEGRSICFYGDALEHHVVVEQGDFLYIPADMPHLPYNPSATEGVVAVTARTDPNEQESVMLLPALDELPHIRAIGQAAAVTDGGRCALDSALGAIGEAMGVVAKVRSPMASAATEQA